MRHLDDETARPQQNVRAAKLAGKPHDGRLAGQAPEGLTDDAAREEPGSGDHRWRPRRQVLVDGRVQLAEAARGDGARQLDEAGHAELLALRRAPRDGRRCKHLSARGGRKREDRPAPRPHRARLVLPEVACADGSNPPK